MQDLTGQLRKAGQEFRDAVQHRAPLGQGPKRGFVESVALRALTGDAQQLDGGGFQFVNVRVHPLVELRRRPGPGRVIGERHMDAPQRRAGGTLLGRVQPVVDDRAGHPLPHGHRDPILLDDAAPVGRAPHPRHRHLMRAGQGGLVDRLLLGRQVRAVLVLLDEQHLIPGLGTVVDGNLADRQPLKDYSGQGVGAREDRAEISVRVRIQHDPSL